MIAPTNLFYYIVAYSWSRIYHLESNELYHSAVAGSFSLSRRRWMPRENIVRVKKISIYDFSKSWQGFFLSMKKTFYRNLSSYEYDNLIAVWAKKQGRCKQLWCLPLKCLKGLSSNNNVSYFIVLDIYNLSNGRFIF